MMKGKEVNQKLRALEKIKQHVHPEVAAIIWKLADDNSALRQDVVVLRAHVQALHETVLELGAVANLAVDNLPKVPENSGLKGIVESEEL